jgi:hypothetical protein
MSRVYRIVHRESKWNAIPPGSDIPIVTADDQRVLIEWTCAVARIHGSEVHVYDETGAVAEIFQYGKNTERDGRWRGRPQPPRSTDASL